MFANKNLNVIIEKYREEKLAHAYLIETNNISKLMEDLNEIVKFINCPQTYQKGCFSCNLCNLIDKNNLPSLITIEPDGASIKKAQIEDLKRSFETKPIYSKYNVYIIKNTEKLNGSSANAMLKFIEEPTEGIIGFFITDNKDVIIPTIKSRCQSLVVNYESDNILDKLNLTEEELNNYKDIIKEYITKIDSSAPINNKTILLSKITERSSLDKVFKLLLEIYYQYFLKNLNKPYNEELTKIIEIQENNQEIITKMNIITKFLQDLRYNVNMELLLDKFVIEMRKAYG